MTDTSERTTLPTAAFSNLPVGLVTSDRAGHILSINEEAMRLLATVDASDPHVTRLDNIVAALSRGAPVQASSIESWFRHLFDNVTTEPLVIALAQDRAVQISGSIAAETIVLLLENCSVEQRTQRLLHELESLMSAGVVEYSLVSDEIFFSPGIWDIFGAGAQQELGHLANWMTFIDPAHRDRVQALVNDSLATGEPYAAEYPMNLPDGRRIWVNASAQLVAGHDGVVDQGVGVFQDTTKLHEQASALHDREARLQAIFDASADIIALLEDGQVRMVSRAVETVLGYGAADLLDTDASLLVHPDDAETLFAELDDLHGDTILRSEGRLRHRDGSWRLVELSARQSGLSPDGAPRLVLLARDVTDYRANELRLRQAEKLESLGLLAGGVAHDFNNLLTTILGNAELLSAYPDDPAEVMDSAAAIRRAADRAAGLTRQLLTFTRHSDPRRERTSAHDIIREAAEMLEHTLDKRFTVELDLTAINPYLDADSNSLHTAVLNLGLNARDAMATTGGCIRFRTGNITMPQLSDSGATAVGGEVISIEVIDSGHGVNETDRERIFDPFFTSKPVGQGTGLGLAAVSGCARSHGGQVTVHETAGGGSTFRMLLPVSTAPAPHRAAPATVERSPAQAHIMVIDDEADIRQLVQQALPRAGFQVTTWASGSEAAEWFASNHVDVDLVLLDMSMPGMSGNETLSALQAIDERVRVVVASGYSMADAPEDLLERGAFDYILKPYHLDTLARTLLRAIG